MIGRSGDRKLRRGWKVAGGAADQRSLLVSRVEKPEAVLKSLAIPDFSLKTQWVFAEGQLKFHLDQLADLDACRYGGADTAFTQVFCPAMHYIFSPDDQPDIQKKSREGPGSAPNWLFFSTGHDVQPPYHKRGARGRY